MRTMMIVMIGCVGLLLTFVNIVFTVADKEGAAIDSTILIIHDQSAISLGGATVCSGACSCSVINASRAGVVGVYNWLSPLNGKVGFRVVYPSTIIRICPVNALDTNR